MKRTLFHRLFVLLSFTLLSVGLQAQPQSDEAISEQLRQYPYRAAGVHCPYIAPEYSDTPAPDGFKAFYVSHFGRHGSRYQTESNAIVEAARLLDTLHCSGLLTASGDSLREDLHLIEAAHEGGMVGMLTTRGTREHTGIARRLVRRCPEIFNPGNRGKVVFTSTPVARTVQSMAGFSAGILTAAPSLDFEIRSGFHLEKNGNPSKVNMTSKEYNRLMHQSVDALTPGEKDLAQFSARIITDPEKARKVLKTESLGAVLVKFFKAGSGAGCLDIDVDPLRFFSPEELFALYKMKDAKANFQYGAVSSVRGYRAREGEKWVRLLLREADTALREHGVKSDGAVAALREHGVKSDGADAAPRCGDFRFFHDGNLGPMMNLLDLGPYHYPSDPEAPYRNFQTYNGICMGSNFQLIFYGNGETGDILVKALYNERELEFPGLDATCKVYYKWTDVRSYIVSKLEGI